MGAGQKTGSIAGESRGGVQCGEQEGLSISRR